MIANRWSGLAAYIALAIGVVFALGPLLLMGLNAFKATPEIITSPLSLPAEAQWSNFTRAWEDARLGETMLNSAKVTAMTIALVLLLVIFAALTRLTARMTLGAAPEQAAPVPDPSSHGPRAPIIVALVALFFRTVRWFVGIDFVHIVTQLNLYQLLLQVLCALCVLCGFHRILATDVSEKVQGTSLAKSPSLGDSTRW